MTHSPQPSRVRPSEISDLLDQLGQLGSDCDRSARLAFFDRKADLLARIADDLGTDEAREVAAAASAQAAACRTGMEVPR
jgi:hypothetical protein